MDRNPPRDERRANARLLCADIAGLTIDGIPANAVLVEDFSLTGMCLQLEHPVAPGARVEIEHARGRLRGVVRHCAPRDGGWVAGVRLDAPAAAYRPEHVFDPAAIGV